MASKRTYPPEEMRQLARCQTAFILLIPLHVFTFCVPFMVCGLMSPPVFYENLAAIVLLISGIGVPLATFYFIYQLARASRVYWFVGLALTVVLPFFAVFGLLLLWSRAAKLLGPEPGKIPLVLAARRCPCGGLMHVSAASQTVVINYRNTPFGCTLRYQCPACRKFVEIPDLVQILYQFWIGVAGVFLVGIVGFSFLRQGFAGSKPANLVVGILGGMAIVVTACKILKTLRNVRDHPLVTPPPQPRG